TRLTMTPTPAASSIPRSASAAASPRSSPGRSSSAAMTVTSAFFTRNRFAVLSVGRLGPVAVLVDRSAPAPATHASSARERRRARKAALKEDLSELAEDTRREEKEGQEGGDGPDPAVVPAPAPIKQVTTSFRRYFHGRDPPKEMFTLGEMRVAERLVSTYYGETRRSERSRRKVEVPLRERVLRRNLVRSLTVLEYRTTHANDERSDWDMTF
ncbi:hypothetical protein PENTCL1PPCAC_9211, partial [Pristionchus entomophagus]